MFYELDVVFPRTSPPWFSDNKQSTIGCVLVSFPLNLEVKNLETKWSPFPIEEGRVKFGIGKSNAPKSASNAFSSFALQHIPKLMLKTKCQNNQSCCWRLFSCGKVQVLNTVDIFVPLNMVSQVIIIQLSKVDTYSLHQCFPQSYT